MAFVVQIVALMFARGALKIVLFGPWLAAPLVLVATVPLPRRPLVLVAISRCRRWWSPFAPAVKYLVPLTWTGAGRRDFALGGDHHGGSRHGAGAGGCRGGLLAASAPSCASACLA